MVCVLKRNFRTNTPVRSFADVDAISRITHELLGQLAQRDVAWTPEKFPSHLMRELLVLVEKGELTGMSRHRGLDLHRDN